MPLYFESVIAEHHATREKATIFDVSHMGKIVLSGKGVWEKLQRLIPSVLPLRKNAGKYTHLLNESGEIIDDIIITCVAKEAYLCICNAGTTRRVFQWFTERLGEKLSYDMTSILVCLAIQGPRSRSMLEKAISHTLMGLHRFQGLLSNLQPGLADAVGVPLEIEGWGPFSLSMGLRKEKKAQPLYITRTGYTGELGFEIFAPNTLGKAIWSVLLSPHTDNDDGVIPAGLGARDTLRLEKGYLLSGEDFDGRQTPLEVGYEWLIDWAHDFVGRKALLQLKREGGYRRLVGLKLRDKGVPRRGNGVYWAGEKVGSLTSGTFSPTLGVGIGLGYLEPNAAKAGRQVKLKIRGTERRATVVKTPFL